MYKLIEIYKESFDGLSREVWQLSLMMFINRLGTLILPFLTLYTTQELVWDTKTAGMAASSFGIGSLAGAYLGGILTDRYGYHRTMIFSLFSATFIFFITQYFEGFYVFCGLLFLGSMFADTLRPALFSGLSYITDENSRTRSISLMRMSFNLGIAIGPAIAGALVVYTGYRSIFIIDAMTCLFAGLYMVFYMKNHERPEEQHMESDENKSMHSSPYTDLPFMLFMASSLIMLIGFFQILSTVPLFIKEGLGYTEKEVGLFFTVNGLIIVLFEMPIIKYIENKGYENFKVLIYGAIMMTLSLLFLAMPNIYLLGLLLYTLLVSFGEIINFPYLSTTAMNRSSEQSRGKYMSLMSMSFSLALIIAPIFGTWLLNDYGWNVLWIGMFVVSLLGTIGFVISTTMLSK